MGRTVNEARITTRNARAQLRVSKVPYWRAIDRGAHLGYRKGRNGGTWIARYRTPEKKYLTAAIGKADDRDKMPADGEEFLDYSQALERARAWCASKVPPDPADEEEEPYTVGNAIADYLSWYEKHRKSLYQVTRRAEVHIKPALGDRQVSELTAQSIRRWHEKLASSPARLRSPKMGRIKTREYPTDPEGIRRRKSTANKCLTILKAALNKAYQDDKVASDDAWRRVKPFRGVDAARVRYLSVAEATRLINACDADFRGLVQSALYTGCRYGELTRMEVGDFNADTQTAHVRFTKNDKDRHVALTKEGAAFFTRLTAGRKKRDLMFLRTDGKQWGPSHQNRPLARACKAAKIDPPIGFHILRHCFGTWLVMNGAPLPVVAASLGHADTRITSKHYGHLAPDYIADTVRASLPDLGVVEPDNVVPLREGR